MCKPGRPALKLLTEKEKEGDKADERGVDMTRAGRYIYVCVCMRS
jgi:hypothetical protein